MSDSAHITPEQFAETFRRVAEWARIESEERSPFRRMLSEHFGADPTTFPVTGEAIPSYDLPNLQLALDAYLADERREHRLVGFGGHLAYAEMSLSGLVHDYGFGVTVGPVRRIVVPLERGRSVTCVTAGLFLISEGERRLAALVMKGQRGYDASGLRLDVIAPEQDEAERFVADVVALMQEHNVFRGKVLALAAGDELMNRGMSVAFPAVEPVARDQIVLPEGVLNVIELHTLEFARHSEALRKAGRHLRRGLLLHGPPGTGKTLSTTYLISRLEDRTVVILTGAALGLISDACAIARALQPAMVVLEDVDLVAQERTAMDFGATSLLFRLLNEMDGGDAGRASHALGPEPGWDADAWEDDDAMGEIG